MRAGGGAAAFARSRQPIASGIGGAIPDERVHGKARREVLVPGDAQGSGRRLRVPTPARARAERSASGVKGCR
ncbi:MAG TPA: hypothetical protein VKB88_37395 [Bryobacteraceae bacterium]|nr:hypothetical protein [Bryobacteraceae bacterium]